MRIIDPVVEFGKDLLKAWDEDKPARLAAGLAYYSLFSLAPLLFIAISVASVFIDEAQLTEQIFTRIDALLGAESAQYFESALGTLEKSTITGRTLTTIISFLALLFAASGLFANLKYSINTIWQIPPSAYAGIKAFIKTRLLAFVIVIGFGLLLVVVAFAGIILSTLNSFIKIEGISSALNFSVVFILAMLTCAVFYKILPDTHVGWRDVWGGAILTVILVSIGLWLVTVFLAEINFTSAMEAAGAVAVILIAIYYMSQIFLLGAEFSKVYAYKYGTRKGELRPGDEYPGNEATIKEQND